jgi:triacylglycerol lipase
MTYAYWGELLSVLRDKVGAEVIVKKVPGTGTIKERAEALHQCLENDERVRGRKINLIGHSMVRSASDDYQLY